MTPDYQAEMERRQQEEQKYQQTRDPFEYGRQVAQRRYSEIMSGIDARQKATAQSYSDMYQAARQQAVKSRAAGGPTLSGGMGAQYSDLLTVAEQQQLGEIGRKRTQAMTDFDLQRQSAIANAELEGQQAAQLQLQNKQTQLSLIQQRNEILGNKELTNEQRAEQLEVLGYTEQAEELRTQPEAEGSQDLTGLLIGSLSVATASSAVKFGLTAVGKKLGAGALGKLFGGAAALVPGFKTVLVLAALAYGVDKALEAWAPEVNQGQGLVGFV